MKFIKYFMVNNLEMQQLCYNYKVFKLFKIKID